MKKQLLAMISVLCLMATSAFALGTKHFDEVTAQPNSLNQTVPVCKPGQVLTYDGTAFQCTNTMIISGCPVGQALSSESATGQVSCVNMTCPANSVLSYTTGSGVYTSGGATITPSPAPVCIPIPTCPSGTVLTANASGTAAQPYSCTTQIAMTNCPPGQAFDGEDGTTGDPICINMTCPPGQTLNYTAAGAVGGGAAPTCITPPACPAGQVLTMNGTTYNCTHAITITCPAGQALSSESAGGATTCLNISCPAGQALSYPTVGAPQCINPPPACPAGQVLTVTGTNASGAIYSCTSNITITPCPPGQAMSSENATGAVSCINLTCPPGETLNTPIAGGPPSCIIPPTCGPGFVLTMTGTTYSCTSDVQTIACLGNTALVSIDTGGIPTCLPVPIGGVCPPGTGISGISNTTTPVCTSIPGAGVCPPGQVVDIINPNGAAPHCISAAASSVPCPAGYTVTGLAGVGQGPAGCVLTATASGCPPGQVLNAIYDVSKPGTGACVTPTQTINCAPGFISGLNDMGIPTCSPPPACP